MRIRVIAIICFLAFLNVNAQKNVFNSGSKPVVKANNFQPNSVIFKIKPQFAKLFVNAKKAPLTSLSKEGVSVVSMLNVFPGAKKPERAVNHNGDSLVDLSLVYKVKFSGNKTVEEVIELLAALPFFEYVEPEYIENLELHYIPNDPEAQPGLYQNYLYRHRFIEAWDLTKGDTNVVVGVLDTGTELTHTDLAANVKHNYAEIPNNGIDDEGDGFIDNFTGWDTGDNDNDPNFDVHGHGVAVQGGCTAVPENNFGIAGGGFNCKAMPIKISNSIGALVGGYSGIYYAADHGCKVINLSWGGFGSYSQTSQNAINYAVINKDVVVVASAGNSDIEADFYPAAYDHVISVSGLDTQYVAARNEVIEKRTYYGPGAAVTYAFSVDISAHTNGMSTYPNNGIGVFGGTSFAAPVVAGAAALVRSYYPTMKADQVMELLRVSGSCLDSFPETMAVSRFKMGRKLDVYKALTNITSPSIRIKKVTASSKFGSTIFSGDTVTIMLDLQNLLSKANNLNVRLVSLGGASLVDSLSVVGFIDSLQYLSNIPDKFKIRINPNETGTYVDLVFLFSDPSKNYYDFQGTRISINPNYLDIDTNDVSLTVFGTGNIGYNDDYFRTEGTGFEYNNTPSLLYSGGLMIGLSNTKVSDCVRGGTFSGNQDFKKTKSIRYSYSSVKDMEATASFNDSLAASLIGVNIDLKTYANKNATESKYVILEYKVTNQNVSQTFDSLFVGIFTDWDINDPSYNRGDWDAASSTLYTYDVQGGGKYAGITLLSGQAPSCFSLDNAAASSGGNINPNDDFTSTEKFTTLANGIKRPQAGYSGFGTDISQVIGAKVKNMGPGQSATVAYAIVVGDNLTSLISAANAAHSYFRSIKTGALPVIANVSICNKDTVDIPVAPSNGTTFSFYSDAALSNEISQGASILLSDVSAADTVYIVNSDSLFDSSPVAFKVLEDAMVAGFQLFPADTLKLDFSQLAFGNNTTTGYSSLSWSDGLGNTFSGTNPMFQYTLPGTYTIKLTATSSMGCVDSMKKDLVVKAITSSIQDPQLYSISIYPNPLSDQADLTVDTEVPVDISVLNVLGEKIEQMKLDHHTQVDVSSWSSGYYYILIRHNDQERIIPFVKQ